MVHVPGVLPPVAVAPIHIIWTDIGKLLVEIDRLNREHAAIELDRRLATALAGNQPSRTCIASCDRLGAGRSGGQDPGTIPKCGPPVFGADTGLIAGGCRRGSRASEVDPALGIFDNGSWAGDTQIEGGQR